jgi:hypothetical protein
VFFEQHPEYMHLQEALFDYSEASLPGRTDNGVSYVRAFVNDFDGPFEEIVHERGYKPDPK